MVPYFGGDLSLIERVKQVVLLPVLRKDFIIDEYQILESRAAGADAILLIAEVLSPAQIDSFSRCVAAMDMTIADRSSTTSISLRRSATCWPPIAELCSESIIGICTGNASIWPRQPASPRPCHRHAVCLRKRHPDA